jgi:methyl-accepting chemotaxis protein
MVYYLVLTRSFNIFEITKLALPIWLAQSLTYGAWKKLGLKRFLALMAKLLFKDLDNNGKISMDEAISQVVKSIKEGKIDVESLVSTVNNSLSDVVEEVSEVSKGTKEAEKVEKVIEALDKESMADPISVAVEIAKPVSIGRAPDGTEIYTKNNTNN